MRFRRTIPWLALLAPLLAGSLAAEEPLELYRVEVIVFTHESGQPDRHRAERIERIRDAVDPRERARQAALKGEDDASDDPDEGADDDTRSALALLEALDALEHDAVDGEPAQSPTPMPETFLALDELTATMADARRRLEASDRYRVRASLAWLQPLSRGQSAPRIRLHDEAIVDIDWLAGGAFGLPGQRRSGEDNAFRSPAVDYRLDGTVRLSQRQFRHFSVDLYWRESERPALGPMDPGFLAQRRFEQHHLVQSRRVRAERLEYFDSSWLGVLVYFEPWHDAAKSDDGDDDSP